MNTPDLLCAGLATLGAIYHCVTSILLGRHFSATDITDPGTQLPPVTFLRPVKPGTSGLQEKIGRLAAALQPADQLLVGVESAADQAACAGWPGVEIVRCTPGRALNPKINKLLQMTPHARHTRWIVTDSEALPDPAFFRRLREEWQAADAVTAGYRFVGAVSLPQLLDAGSVLLTLWPGLMVARQHFLLGACFAVHKEQVDKAGGWEALADVLDEDRRLGSFLARCGNRLRLSRAVLALETDPCSWRDWWEHQRRVAFTYRIAAPAGWAGMPLVYSMAWAVAFAVLAPGSLHRWLLPAAAWAVRYVTARWNARLLGFDPRQLALVTLLHSLCEPCWWAASWMQRRVRWGAHTLRVTRDGRILGPPAPAPGRSQ